GRPRFLHPEERQPLAPAARPEGGGQGRVGNPGAAPQRRRARAEGAGAARQGGVIARGYSAASASGSSSAASTKPQSAAISPAAAASEVSSAERPVSSAVWKMIRVRRIEGATGAPM